MKFGRQSLNWKQKILLDIFSHLGNEEYSRLKVFKIVFLLSRKLLNRKNNFYNFVPYKYGPYSFEMDKDLRAFNNNGWIKMQDKLISINKDIIRRFSFETEFEKEVYETTDKYKSIDEENLLDFIYKGYPYYSQNSLLVKQHKVERQSAEISIYTIGYQNLSIDMFINVLIEKGIKTVLDVRNKPLSYKYGFNYYWLNKYLPWFNIKYIGIPELGIEEKYRKIFSQEQLWKHYMESLEGKKDYLDRACDIIKEQPTVLMCFEMNPEDCHRLRLAKKIKEIIDLPVINYHIQQNQWKKLNY